MPNANKLTPRWWWWRREHEEAFWDGYVSHERRVSGVFERYKR